MELFEHAFPIEDGVIHGPNGKYIFPAAGATKPKELTRRRTRNLVIIALAVLLVAAAVAAYLADTGVRELKLYNEIVSCVGKPVDALQQEAIPLLEIGESSGKLDGKVKYVGAEFDVYVYFDEQEGLLNAFEYTAVYNADARSAAKNISRFMDQFLYTDTVQIGGETINVSRGALRKMFQNGNNISLEYTSSLTPTEVIPGDSVSAYLQYLENAEYYDGRVGEYITKKPQFYRDVYVDYSSRDGVVTTTVRFSVESDRSKK